MFSDMTWYGDFGDFAIRIQVKDNLDGMAVSAMLMSQEGKSVRYTVDEAVEQDSKLRLVLSHDGSGGFPEKIDIQLRLPDDEWIADVSIGSDCSAVVMKNSIDAPKIRTRFSDVNPGLAEEVRGEMRDACACNLKMLGLTMKMYSNEHERRHFPILDPRPGHLMFLANDLWPEYLYDTKILKCPTDESVAKPENCKPEWFFEHSSYLYLGYAMNNEEQGLAFLKAYRHAASRKKPLGVDLKDKESKYVFRRLREGVEEFFITEPNNPAASTMAQSTIPVLIERPGRHSPDGGHVLYMDGHVEYLPYPSKFPMTEAFIEGLQDLEELRGNGGDEPRILPFPPTG